MKFTEQQKNTLAYLSTEISHIKSDLLNVAERMAEISPAKSRRLEAIIGSLEHFQVQLPRRSYP